MLAVLASFVIRQGKSRLRSDPAADAGIGVEMGSSAALDGAANPTVAGEGKVDGGGQRGRLRLTFFPFRPGPPAISSATPRWDARERAAFLALIAATAQTALDLLWGLLSP